MQYILGIDVGGSKAEVVLANADGDIISAGRFDSGQDLANEPHDKKYSRLGGGREIGSLNKALEMTIVNADLPDDEVIDITISSHTGNFPLHTLFGLNLGNITVNYATEFSPVYELAGTRYSALALAGTGAAVVCNLPDGKGGMYMDGAGPELGDFGGGCYVGKRALRAVQRSIWHEKYETSLKEALPLALGLPPAPTHTNHYEALVQYALSHHDRGHTAGLARIVGQEAEKGDKIATELLVDASNQLSDTLSLVIDRLDCHDIDLPLICFGSLLAKSDIYYNNFTNNVKGFAPNLKPLRITQSPAVGHILSVIKKLYPDEYQNRLRDKVFKNAENLEFNSELSPEKREEYYSKGRKKHHGH